MQNPLKDRRQIKYYLLDSIRRPDAWLEANRRSGNVQQRYETRLQLAQLLKNSCMRFADNEQYIFVAHGEELEILEGEVLSDLKLALEDGILCVDLEHNRVIFEQFHEDGKILWQSTGSSWVRVRTSSKSKLDTSNDHIHAFKQLLARKLEESDLFLASIRARKKELEDAE